MKTSADYQREYRKNRELKSEVEIKTYVPIRIKDKIKYLSDKFNTTDKDILIKSISGYYEKMA